MKYTVRQLDGTKMPVSQFLKEHNEIPYDHIVANFHEITISELYEKYYDKEILFDNIPKDYGDEEGGVSVIFDRLYAEVLL